MKKPMIAMRSGANSTLGTQSFLRHALEGGCQQILRTVKFVVPAKAGTQGQAAEILGSRFRGNDKHEGRQISELGATGKGKQG
jgi:hypothetical protein